MKRIVVKPEDCAGCRQCEMVCSFRHSKAFSPSISRVTVLKDDRHGLDYPLFCRHCEDCPPLENCPMDAMLRLNGIIKVDGELCTGCGLCIEYCKYEAVKLLQGKVIICDLCGGEVECVKRCPTGALDYVDAPEFTEKPYDAFTDLKRRWGIID